MIARAFTSACREAVRTLWRRVRAAAQSHEVVRCVSVSVAVATLWLTAGVAHAGTATLTCIAPTTRTDGSALTGAVTFKVYRGTSSAAVASATTPIAMPATCAYTDTAAPSGTVFYAVSAVDSAGVESAKTAAVSVVIPVALPSAPTGLTATAVIADTTVFKQRQAVDGFVMVAIGTAPPLTQCSATNSVTDTTGTYTAIPRSAVTLRSKFDTLPLVVYARCA